MDISIQIEIPISDQLIIEETEIVLYLENTSLTLFAK